MGEVSKERPPTLQLIDGKGNFNQAGLDSFVKDVQLGECGLSYAVVSIMGPQSSGKSTLLNHLFHTCFREMDAFKGRSQTTQGVWLAKAVGLKPCTLILDLEGTDGRERGEDDTTFEKQSALFALAVSDIVLINMWCHDIGREHAANKPLLKTVFQVMMRLFTPRRTTLLFVIRDKTKTPLEILEPILREDIRKIWDSVPKPSKFETTPLDTFFNVEVTALASYEEKEEQFQEQVAQLQTRFMDSIAPGGLAGDRTAVVPGGGFSLSAQEMWKIIKENKDLDLPAHKVMVATVRCDEIAQQKILELSSHEEWKDLQESANSGPVIGFGNRLRALLDRIISGYDTEAAYFEGSVRDKKRNLLVSRSFEIAQPAYQAVIGHHRAKAFDNFKNNLNLSSKSLDQGFTSFVQSCRKTCLDEFDKGCADAHIPQAGWDSLKARDKLQRDIEACVASVREQKLLEIENVFKRRLEEALALPAASLLDAASSDTWPALRKLFHREIEIAKAGLSAAIAGYELDENSTEKMLSDLSEFGRSVIEKKAREEASKALMRMKDRFMAVFSHDAESMPRVWSKEEDISAITKDARLAALKLLSIVAAIRLDEKSDTVEAALTSLIGDGQEIVQRSAGNFTSSEHRSAITSASNALASSTWEGIAGEDTLLTPVQCRNLWRQFKSETEYTISQALAAQEASRRAVSWLPPPWAILVMIVLGFNEFMALLRNPIYLAVGFVLYLLGKALWVQLDIGREFQHGFLAGALSVSSKLLPTLMTILKRLVEEGQQLGASEDSVTANGRRYNKEIQMHEFDSRASSNESSSANGHDVSGCSYEAETR